MENIKMVFRKTSNYNANIVIEDFNGNQVEIATCYATFTTGESVTKSIVFNPAHISIYYSNKEYVDGLISQFNNEVDDLATFHTVPVL